MKRIHWRSKKREKKQDINTKKSKKPEVFETIQDQIESPNTSAYCSESIKEEGLKDINKHPEMYIEINMVKKIRIVDNFFIKADTKSFKYKDTKYIIDEEKVYLLPTKSGYIMPTAFYFEKNTKPTSFKQTNVGITGKALSLLYDENLYIDLFSVDESKYNFVIVILLIIGLCAYAGGMYVYFSL